VDDPFRIGKAYTIREAAALADVSPGTVRNWLYGTTKGDMKAVFGGKTKPAEEVAMVSFLELAEVIVAARFRKLRLKLQRIRAAHDYAKKHYNLAYPFAHLELRSIGGHVLHEFEEREPENGPHFVVLSAPQQFVLPDIVDDELGRFDYSEEDKLATRWYPFGRDLPVVVDPRFGGGQPTIEGRGVTVEVLKKRWKEGKESFQSIARDFRLKAPIVEAVLQRVA
jgi:uncharacterized protein (DUF433 family)